MYLYKNINYIPNRYIYSKNRANLTYTLAVNQFADYYDEEYHKFNVNRGKIENVQHIEKPFPYGNSSFKDLYLPDSFDWRLLGAVTPVRGISQLFFF